MRPPKARVTPFGVFLEAERNRQSLSSKQLARLAGISTSYLSQLETGAKIPTRRVIRAISGALDIHPNSLLNAANILVMPLDRGLHDQREAVVFSVEVDAEEQAELEIYLSFLRFRESLGSAKFTVSK